jgi:hypothetical protein
MCATSQIGDIKGSLEAANAHEQLPLNGQWCVAAIKSNTKIVIGIMAIPA